MVGWWVCDDFGVGVDCLDCFCNGVGVVVVGYVFEMELYGKFFLGWGV